MAGTDAKSIFDTPPDKQDDARRDAVADAEIDAGKGVPHATVRDWLMRLVKGEKGPPPSA